MIAYAGGFVTALFLVGVYVCRHDLADLPRVWREEPDYNLRGWLVFIRRRLTGYSILEPSFEIPNPHRVLVRWRSRPAPFNPEKPISERGNQELLGKKGGE